jgi:tetratricopeptide (TPR) repeat protein
MGAMAISIALVALLAAAAQGTPRAAPAPDPAALIARALEHQKAGRLAEAASEYERFLAVVPGAWEARSNLGVVYAQLGRYTEAVEAYRRVLEQKPANVAVRLNLALALYKAARLREAVSELEKVLKEQPHHPSAPLLLADCHLQLGEWKQVIAILDPLLEKDPDNAAILYMLGTALMRDKQYARGQAVVDRILRQGDSAEAHLMLALASREAQDDLAAKVELDKALALNPELPTANGLLGDVLMSMGEGAAAREAFRRELSVNPNDFESHLMLGLILRQDYDNEGAREHIEKALLLRPGDPGALYQMALVHIAKNELAPALEILEGLVAEAPRWLEAQVSLTTVYYRLGRREDGNRHQQIVRELRQAEQAHRDAELQRKQSAQP